MINKNIKAKKHFGQNFLVDKNVINKIIATAQIKNKDILEIGPGQGALTSIMINEANSLIAYEVDKDMIEILNSNISNDNFELIHQDFLKAELNWENKKEIVANLPYYITSDILFKIFDNIDKFSRLTIMVQDEVANRIVAKVNNSEYGKLAVSSQYLAEVKKEFIVYPNSFIPAPKVNSAIVSFFFKEVIDKEEMKRFLNFVKNCFAMKRKTLNNNLKVFLSNEIIQKIFKSMNFKDSIRPQEISVKEYEEMFKIAYE